MVGVCILVSAIIGKNYSMEFTLDQALQTGIIAHSEGRLKEAARFYRAILQAQPDHPDANHNLGLLDFGLHP